MADPISFGLTVALSAAQMAMTMTRKIEGPRLTDLKVSVADFGTPLNYFYGIRRFQGNPIIFAEDIIEIKKKKKTKGGKYNDYTYYCTWAVVIADHEIDAVTRIWFDKHLVYDATGPGPITPFDFGDFNSVARKRLQNSSPTAIDHIRIYLGTEDQEPDPRMLATVEAKHGAGSCPAYLGVSYILFEDVPLEKVGNRIPQISVEAISNAAPNYPYESIEGQPAGLARLWGFTYSPDFSRFATFQSDAYTIWDVAARSKMIGGTLTGHDYVATPNYMGVANDGSIYMVAFAGFPNSDIVRIPPDGVGPGGALFTVSPEQQAVQVRQDGRGIEWILTIPRAFNRTWYSYRLDALGALLGPQDHTPDYQAQMFFTDGFGDIWTVGILVGPFQNPTQFYLQRVIDTGVRGGFIPMGIIPTSGAGPSGTVAGLHYLPSRQFVVLWCNSMLYAIDDETFAIKHSRAITTDGYNSPKQFANWAQGANSIWLNNVEISLDDLSTIRTVHLTDWTSQDSDGIIYDPINHALITAPQLVDLIIWRYLDRVGSDGVTLQTIIEDVATRSGIDPANLDASDCDQTVTGYSWTQGSGKAILEPLCDAYDSFCRPHNFSLQFLKRGGASTGTIDVAQFVRQGDNRYVLPRTLDTDLPFRVWFNFADIDADQQPNDVPSQRVATATQSKRELSIDLTTLALSADDARNLADRVFRRRWGERVTLNNALSAQYLGIEAGDVKVFTLDAGQSFRGRASRWTYGADGVIALEWKRDDTAFAVLADTEGAPFDGREDSVIAVPLISKGFVLDIPLITDSDNSVNPLLYFGAGPYSSGSWPGAILYQSLDDGEEYSTEVASAPSTAGLTWGYASDALPDADPWLWDRGSSIDVTIKYGSLTGTTEAICNSAPTTNLALLGDELIQFTTATLLSEDSNGKVYTLSGFKRGRRGTEWACGTHLEGDRFILLDQVDDFEMGASDIGTDLLFKAVTVGRNADSAFPVNIAPYTAASHKPYAPAGVMAEKDPVTGDWTIDWTRRSRIGGAWTSGTSVPLGEATEAYQVDILDAPGGTVLHTYLVTSPTVTFDAADQTSYAGGDVTEGDLFFEVYQISDVAGRGFAREASF